MDNLFEKIPESLRSGVLTIFYAIIIYIVGKIAIKYLLKIILKFMKFNNFDEGIFSFVTAVVNIALNVLLVLSCAITLKIDVTPILTAISAAGLAVSLAMKDSLANLAGGVFIIVSKPFERNDFVEMCGVSGSIKEIGLLHTIAMTADNKKIYIPNGDIAKATIINYSSEDFRRLDLTFSVACGRDWHRAKDIIFNIASSFEKIKPETVPTVAVSDFSQNSVNLICRMFISSADFTASKYNLNEQIRTALDDESLTVPYQNNVIISVSDIEKKSSVQNTDPESRGISAEFLNSPVCK